MAAQRKWYKKWLGKEKMKIIQGRRNNPCKGPRKVLENSGTKKKKQAKVPKEKRKKEKCYRIRLKRETEASSLVFLDISHGKEFDLYLKSNGNPLVFIFK